VLFFPTIIQISILKRFTLNLLKILLIDDSFKSYEYFPDWSLHTYLPEKYHVASDIRAKSSYYVRTIKFFIPIPKIINLCSIHFQILSYNLYSYIMVGTMKRQILRISVPTLKVQPYSRLKTRKTK
jgi:hypothetical protein